MLMLDSRTASLAATLHTLGVTLIYTQVMVGARGRSTCGIANVMNEPERERERSSCEDTVNYDCERFQQKRNKGSGSRAWAVLLQNQDGRVVL